LQCFPFSENIIGRVGDIKIVLLQEWIDNKLYLATESDHYC
jgi:hypothetical protein